MEIKILSYNIHKGMSSLGIKSTLERIKSAAKETSSSVCFIQEIMGQNKSAKESQFENQLEYLADSVWGHYSYGKNAAYPRGDHGNAILSEYPIIQDINIDLTLNKFEKRGLQHVIIHEPETSKKINLLNTHLNLRSSHRLRQIEIIKKYVDLNLKEDEPVIFCGDFNDWNFDIHDFITKEMNFQEAHLEFAGSLPKTFPSRYPVVCLDRVYFKNLHITKINKLGSGDWWQMSDHLPLSVHFSTKPISGLI